MDSFKAFYQDRRRHMRPISRVTKAHPGKYVPEVHRTKMENKKYENILNGTSKIELLSTKDISELQKKFNFAPDLHKPVKLGNTGIQLIFKNGKFILTK